MGSVLYTEEDLMEFNRLTAMESSLRQMERIEARLLWGKWVEENNFSKYILDEMKEELIRRKLW